MIRPTLFRARAALAAALLSLAPLSPAFAHAHLRTANPAADSTVAVAPAEVACSFTEALEPRFSSLEVQDAAGARVDAGDMHLAPDDAKRMVVGLKKLGAGTYTVIWHAVAVDTHRTEGSFHFQVAP